MTHACKRVRNVYVTPIATIRVHTWGSAAVIYLVEYVVSSNIMYKSVAMCIQYSVVCQLWSIQCLVLWYIG